MVDLDNLVKIANSGQFPDLMNSSDVNNIKELINAQSLGSSIDLGIIKTSPTKPTRYGIKVEVPTGVSQVQLCDGTILENKIFRYLADNKSIYFEEGKPDVPIEECLYFGSVPLFAPTIDALCELATIITDNNDTSKLRELLNLLEDVVPDNDDYALTTLVLNKSNKSIKFGLNKISDQTVSTDVFKFLGTRSNTKLYQSIQSASMLTEDVLLNESNRTEVYFEFNSTGLVKELAFALYPRYHKSVNDYVEEEDYGGVSKEQRHTNTISQVKECSWMPDKWSDEIFRWENHHPTAVYAVAILTAQIEGFQVELEYGY